MHANRMPDVAGLIICEINDEENNTLTEQQTRVYQALIHQSRLLLSALSSAYVGYLGSLPVQPILQTI